MLFDVDFVEKVVKDAADKYQIPEHLMRRYIYNTIHVTAQHSLIANHHILDKPDGDDWVLESSKTLNPIAPEDQFQYVNGWPCLVCYDPLTNMHDKILLPLVEMPHCLPAFEENMRASGFEPMPGAYELTWHDPLGVEPTPENKREFLKTHVTGANRIPHFFGQKSQELTYTDEALSEELWDAISPILIRFIYHKDTESKFPAVRLGSMGGLDSDCRVIVARYLPDNTIAGAYLYQVYENIKAVFGSIICRDFNPLYDKYSVMLGLNLALIFLRPFDTIVLGSNMGSENAAEAVDNAYKKNLKFLKSMPVHAWRARG